nr:MAG TPA: hypothetical protein [Caudoviricetes sp.]
MSLKLQNLLNYGTCSRIKHLRDVQTTGQFIASIRQASLCRSRGNIRIYDK